ncbi:30S ribosomal protein S12 methylthiotransferase RimO [Maridesulfovibrio salexigens]|uniref:Ribosomal protein uS12 methylthiotransferase RimO n=1 Tax=Maridesulfovibrio salexigens (strain ATCC 14822 / DSM 2638 / NCIMB 8403 / VKM B-1763) TaxID=526222 RepID=C6BTD4_MARSD|nr:30S ribosomal protein S12 methylthiotransferase RimO [Maridesulfovibrio salexigens]ACS81615.1 MiaB-like tRNA modifying enzyme YliG [Maridesulfovibrio salexigens DSM 2638]
MNMTKTRIYTISLGCPKNRVDTERMLGAFGDNMIAASTAEESDLVLINTCGFIGPATEESVDTILETADAIKDLNPRPVLAVAGCLVSRYGKLTEQMPEVDLWLSTHELDQWPALAAKALRKEFPVVQQRAISTGPAYAYLKISEGCSHSCRFCTIPSIRGPHVSRKLDGLVEEARYILDQGVPELVIVGQDTTAYGSDLDDKETNLRALIEKLLPLKGMEWLRLMYLYPAGLTDSMLSFLAQAGKPLLPYFDIPIQHAHPDVLSSMGRPFARDPRKVIDRVRKHIPDAVLRTSIIVGYPGETDEHFNTLVDFVKETRFQNLGVFAYQPEEGTPAGEMEQLPEELREERREILMEVQSEISREILEEKVGDTIQVLVEEPNDEWPGLFNGRVWFQAPEVDGITYVSAPEDGMELKAGMMVEAEIDNVTDYDLVTLVK